MFRAILAVLLLSHFPSHADFEAISITHHKGKGGQSLLCYKPFLQASQSNCVIVHLEKDVIKIDYFSDEALSQQLDRGLIFGETDPMRLHVKTEIWLEQILLPAIQEHLQKSAVPIQKVLD